MNTQFDCPHCHAITVVPEDADFDGLCGSCQEDLFRYPAEDTHEESPASATNTDEGEEQISNTNSANQPTLTQVLVNTLFEMIIDTKFDDRDGYITAADLNLNDVEQICHRFDIPLAEVLEIARVGVMP